MEKLTVQIKNKKAINFLGDIEDLNLIKVIEKPKNKLKERIKRDIEEGFKAIKLHQEGKIKLNTARQLFNEL